jgi:two-component system, NtrC family, sensor kinase
MSIRAKVIALIAALFAILALAGVLVARFVLMPSFLELENKDAATAIRRVTYLLDQSLDQLAVSATSWGNWADTYRFAQDHNRTYVFDNITAVGLRQLNINLLAIVDATGKIIASGSLDSQSEGRVDFDLISSEYLPVEFPWRANLKSGLTAWGFLPTNQGILMLAGAPVLDGFGHGLPRGMVLMGRLLSMKEVKTLGAEAQAALAIVPATGRSADRLMEVGDGIRILHPVTDLYGRPVMELSVDMPREVTRRGYSAVWYACGYIACAAVIMLSLLVLVLNRVILGPLARVTRHAVAIGEDKDLTPRLDFKGRDEIGVLAREFDRMVGRVAESRSQLVDKSFQAGYAELSRGVLHNLGNAMTPIGVRLSTLRSRLQSIAAGELALAAAELADSDAADAIRRSDLQDFLRMGCAQLESITKAMEADVEVVARQTAIVQSALSEQMRSVHEQHVMETLCLSDLVTQSLDVVPDTARALLRIELDKSLDGIGPVSVPRTVLRLVLQNIVINAADSVREAGRPAGVLRITAEVREQAGRDQLLIRCCDDGVGIPTADLGRIFENGFSTKSKQTNFGIGLHWCANAINALGGQLWATSLGVGCGATMHLMVPLVAASSQKVRSVRAA